MGKKEISIADMLMELGHEVNGGTNKQAAQILQDLGWVRLGRKRREGSMKSIWERAGSKEIIEYEILKLELIDKRQEKDVLTVERLMEKGYTAEQTLKYLMMLYNSDIDKLDLTTENEDEAVEFADGVVETVGGKDQTIKMFWSNAYTYYIDKYFPELADSDRYKKEDRRVYSYLDYIPDEPKERTEWHALSFRPNFLDLCVKIPDSGDLKEFKEYILTKFLTENTIDILLDGKLDVKRIAAMCILARKLKNKLKFSYPYGIDQDWVDQAYLYLEELHKNYTY